MLSATPAKNSRPSLWEGGRRVAQWPMRRGDSGRGWGAWGCTGRETISRAITWGLPRSLENNYNHNTSCAVHQVGVIWGGGMTQAKVKRRKLTEAVKELRLFGNVMGRHNLSHPMTAGCQNHWASHFGWCWLLGLSRIRGRPRQAWQ